MKLDCCREVLWVSFYFSFNTKPVLESFFSTSLSRYWAALFGSPKGQQCIILIKGWDLSSEEGRRIHHQHFFGKQTPPFIYYVPRRLFFAGSIGSQHDWNQCIQKANSHIMNHCIYLQKESRKLCQAHLYASAPGSCFSLRTTDHFQPCFPGAKQSHPSATAAQMGCSGSAPADLL